MAELYVFIATLAGVLVPVIIAYGWFCEKKQVRTDLLLTALTVSILFLGLMMGECL